MGTGRVFPNEILAQIIKDVAGKRGTSARSAAITPITPTSGTPFAWAEEPDLATLNALALTCKDLYYMAQPHLQSRAGACIENGDIKKLVLLHAALLTQPVFRNTIKHLTIRTCDFQLFPSLLDCDKLSNLTIQIIHNTAVNPGFWMLTKSLRKFRNLRHIDLDYSQNGYMLSCQAIKSVRELVNSTKLVKTVTITGLSAGFPGEGPFPLDGGGRRPVRHVAFRSCQMSPHVIRGILNLRFCAKLESLSVTDTGILRHGHPGSNFYASCLPNSIRSTLKHLHIANIAHAGRLALSEQEQRLFDGLATKIDMHHLRTIDVSFDDSMRYAASHSVQHITWTLPRTIADAYLALGNLCVSGDVRIRDDTVTFDLCDRFPRLASLSLVFSPHPDDAGAATVDTKDDVARFTRISRIYVLFKKYLAGKGVRLAGDFEYWMKSKMSYIRALLDSERRNEMDEDMDEEEKEDTTEFIESNHAVAVLTQDEDIDYLVQNALSQVASVLITFNGLHAMQEN